MRIRNLAWIALLLFPPSAEAQYKAALPGYKFEFPRDHFSHPDYQTEWWYFTGNLTGEDGHRLGFELTFFRQGVDRERKHPDTAWDIKDLYLAHLALSDLSDGEFYHAERTNRAGPGIAGIDETTQRIWNGNWSVAWSGADLQLQAVDERFALSFSLHPEKPPVIHGENGVSQKAEGPGRASHYISFTRLKTNGTIEVSAKKYRAAGTAWMDHEFFTHQLDANQAGWDWLSIQLNDNTELMLYRIRRKDGSVDPYSSGTYVDDQGKSLHLRASDFTMTPFGDTWKSPITSAKYPIQWRLSIPKLAIELETETNLKSQEISGQTKSTPNYWEGAVSVNGHIGISSLAGVGYLEMTGYDQPIVMGPR